MKDGEGCFLHRLGALTPYGIPIEGFAKSLELKMPIINMLNILILDEPSQGISPKLTVEIFKALGKLKESGCTILLAEQNVYYALQTADSAYVMETGKIMLEGRGKELLNNDHVKKAFLGL
jgi:branched-chain amino acid transport system ATP-binding protein